MKTLSDEIAKQLDEIDIVEANVLEVSRTALVFEHFEAISNQLITKCSDFLKLILITDNDLAVFCDMFVRHPEEQQMVLDLLNMKGDKYDDVYIFVEKKHKVCVKSEDTQNPGGKIEGPDKEFDAVLPINTKEGLYSLASAVSENLANFDF